MSFLSELKNKKTKLKLTETVVTTADGQRYVEGKCDQMLPSTYGFIVDTKPDNVPALLTDHLYIGSQDCTAEDIVQAYNIKHVLSLGIKVNVSVNQKYVECLDLPETDVKQTIIACLPYIKSAIELGENVLVHCNAGVSRTSMVAIAYLMHYETMSYEEAYSLVKERRPAVQPNTGFRNQLRDMKPGQLI